MRSILYILDKPIQMNVKTFKENIRNIKQEWDNIDKALWETTQLLKYFGFSDDNLMAYNAVMPILYYVYKGGIINDKETKEELRKYFVVSQLEKLYGVASNSTLTEIRNALRIKDDKDGYKLKNNKFKYSDLKDVKIVGDRDFSIDDNKIEKWFDNDKGNYTFNS